MTCLRGNQLHPMPCAELEGFHARGSQAELCHLSTAHITEAFQTAPPETEITLHRGSTNTSVSAASRPVLLLIIGNDGGE